MDFFGLLKALIPTMVVFSSLLSWQKDMIRTAYREVFGSHEIYVDLYFERDPRLGEGRRIVPFHGYYVTPQGEQIVSGTRLIDGDQVSYQFQTTAGTFEGSLKREKNRCEPLLPFTLVGDESKVQTGTLRAGFCR